jgi:hypothetical protein
MQKTNMQKNGRRMKVTSVVATALVLVAVLGCQPKRDGFDEPATTRSWTRMFPVPLSSVVLSIPPDDAMRRWNSEMAAHGWELAGEMEKWRCFVWLRSSGRRSEKVSLESLWIVFAPISERKTRVAAFYGYYIVDDDLGYTYTISDEARYEDEFRAIVRSVRTGN